MNVPIPIVNGNYTDIEGNIRTAYPINFIGVYDNNGLSDFCLQPAEGLVKQGEGVGTDRGGKNWNGVCYRVMGTKLCSIDYNGNLTALGDVGGSGQVTFDYGFDRLAIASSGKLYYWNGTTLVQVTDVDLGNVVDMLWVDGFYMTTDGTYLVVTDLNDPTAVNPLKYGSSEADPDPIKALVKIKNEVYALNRYTTELFNNIGGTLFPFARIEGAQIQRGSVGTYSCCLFMDSLAFLGGGKNEPVSVWIASNATSVKLATNEIDIILSKYSESQLKNAVLEVRFDKIRNLLYVHLPDQTLVYDGAASTIGKEFVWYILRSSLDGKGQYKAKNFVYCYEKWLVGDPTSNVYGYMSNSISDHYLEQIGWEFSTNIGYNKGKGVIVNSLELTTLPGRNKFNTETAISTQYSTDGLKWSQEKFKSVGKSGETNKRIVWHKQGRFENWRIQKFKGNSDAFISIVRLDADMEGLNV